MRTLMLSKSGHLAQSRATIAEDPDVVAMSLTTLLAEFRQYMECELEVSTLADCQIDAGLFLNDLCEFLHLGDHQRLQVVGQAVFEFIGDPLPDRMLM